MNQSINHHLDVYFIFYLGLFVLYPLLRLNSRSTDNFILSQILFVGDFYSVTYTCDIVPAQKIRISSFSYSPPTLSLSLSLSLFKYENSIVLFPMYLNNVNFFLVIFIGFIRSLRRHSLILRTYFYPSQVQLSTLACVFQWF